ncbi:Mlc2p TDEL_0H00260 [Torulaspora delbrueckii]|uniref:EF-hand domain-containing protein n=1 Tax=Torulaspora delbrueckii TaxID=4950 RepID=G8ZZ41_TORDE|nr:hypothetical protein TDEL_0H00260 [Torulaspora delbrueckii]CCE93885.1 hypothetical protein TDEL_0H00260 [Torulaspora delbrueckii]
MQSSESLNFSQLSQNHIKTLKDAFQMLDDDGDSRVSQKDLKTMYRSIGKQLTDEQANEMLQVEGSEDKNGISFPEYLAVMSKTVGEFPEDSEIIDCLKTLSGNDDLQIPLDELVQQLREAGFQDPESEFEKIFKDFTARNQVVEGKTFKGSQFMDMISD